jgi:hypothetical protein
MGRQVRGTFLCFPLCYREGQFPSLDTRVDAHPAWPVTVTISRCPKVRVL